MKSTFTMKLRNMETEIIGDYPVLGDFFLFGLLAWQYFSSIKVSIHLFNFFCLFTWSKPLVKKLYSL